MPGTKWDEKTVELATIDLSLFKPVTLDIVNSYEKGRMRILLVGPAFRVHWEDTDAEIVEQKYGIDERTLSKISHSMLWVFHLVCSGEVPETLEELKKKNAAAADALSKKVTVIEEIMAEHPTIRTGFYAYTLSETGFFDEISWTAELRAFHSRNVYVPEPHPPYPIGRVTLTTGSLKGSEIEPKTFWFDITVYDLGALIESLQELKEALLNLQQKRLVEA